MDIMEIFQSFIEIRQLVMVQRFPVKERLKVSIRSWEECEAVLSGLCGFWEEVSAPIYFREVVEYQVSVLKFQVRLQKSSHIRMIHQRSADGRLLLDLVVLFDYGFSPASIDCREEMEKVRECFGRIPKDFYKSEDSTIVPLIVYDNNRVRIERKRLSRIKAVGRRLIEVNESFDY